MHFDAKAHCQIFRSDPFQYEACIQQANRVTKLTEFYETASSENIAQYEESTKPSRVITSLLALPLVLKEIQNAIQARTWKECAKHVGIAAVVGAVSGFFLWHDLR